MTLEDWGWNPDWQTRAAESLRDGEEPARVIAEHRELFIAATAAGEVQALVSGNMQYEASGRTDLPVIGDWITVRVLDDRQAVVQRIIPRRGLLSRRAAGAEREQPLAANVDLALIMIGLDGNYNLRRAERYLAIAWAGGATPVVILNKADLCADVARAVADMRAIAGGAAVLAVSAGAGSGMNALYALLAPGTTMVLLGSSGVGKSTLTNRLLGTEAQRVLEVRADDSRGRHATTHRQLFPLSGGAVLIDTPGMRELGMWDAAGGVEQAFADIEALAAQCRFTDCRHEHEPGCAVQAALADGRLSSGHVDNYRQLLRERAYAIRQVDQNAARADQKRWKQIAKQIRGIEKQRG